MTNSDRLRRLLRGQRARSAVARALALTLAPSMARMAWTRTSAARVGKCRTPCDLRLGNRGDMHTRERWFVPPSGSRAGSPARGERPPVFLRVLTPRLAAPVQRGRSPLARHRDQRILKMEHRLRRRRTQTRIATVLPWLRRGEHTPRIKPRGARFRTARHICRLRVPNRDALVQYANFIGDPADYVLDQLIDTTIAKIQASLRGAQSSPLWRSRSPTAAGYHLARQMRIQSTTEEDSRCDR